MNGKGDKPRPTDKKKFDQSWERIFNNSKPKVELYEPDFDSQLGEMYGKFRQGNNRGLRESDNTSEASGSTIQPPS